MLNDHKIIIASNKHNFLKINKECRSHIMAHVKIQPIKIDHNLI